MSDCQGAGVYCNKVPLTENSVAIGGYLIIEIIPQPNSARKFGNIFLPGEHTLNTQLIVGEIKSSGNRALIEGMNVGELVLYDRASAFGHPPEKAGTLISTHMENVIAKVILEDGRVEDAIPFGDRLMVGDYKKVETEVAGIFIPDSALERSNYNVVKRLGVGNLRRNGTRTEFPVKEGDNIVMVYDKCVEISMNKKKCYIIHLNNVLGVVVDDEPQSEPKPKVTKPKVTKAKVTKPKVTKVKAKSKKGKSKK